VVGPVGELTPKWRDVVQHDDGKVFSFTGGAPTEEAARRAIEGVIAKKTRELGRRPNIIESRVLVTTHRDWQPYGADTGYNYAKQGRAIAKMAYHYLSTQMDRQFLCTRDFEPIKRFVRFGEHPRQPRFCQPALAAELGSPVEPSIRHCLELRCSHQLRSATCDVTLFGSLRFTVVLSYSYEGPDLYRRLTEHPLEGRWEEGPAQDVTPIPAKLVLNVSEDEDKARYARLGEAVHALAYWLNVQNFCRHIRRTLPAAIEAVNSNRAAEGVNSDRWLAAVANGFSDRSAPAALLHFLGEPSAVAAGILAPEFSRCHSRESGDAGRAEDRFARLIFVRLLVDVLARTIESRGGALRCWGAEALRRLTMPASAGGSPPRARGSDVVSNVNPPPRWERGMAPRFL
jgi:hypothetical protein